MKSLSIQNASTRVVARLAFLCVCTAVVSTAHAQNSMAGTTILADSTSGFRYAQDEVRLVGIPWGVDQTEPLQDFFNLHAGKTIIIDEGTYRSDSIQVPNSTKIVAKHGAKLVAVDHASWGAFITMNRDSHLEGFLIDCSAKTTAIDTQDACIRMFDSADSAHVINNTLIGSRLHGIFMRDVEDAVIEKNIIYIGNGTKGIFCSSDCNYNHLSWNTIQTTATMAQDGIQIHGTDGGGGTYSSYNVIEHNRLRYLHDAGGGGPTIAIEVWSGANDSSFGNIVQHNLIWSSGGIYGISMQGQFEYLVDNNMLYVNTMDDNQYIIGLECADCNNGTFSNNFVERVSEGIGLAINANNQTRYPSNNIFEGNIIQDVNVQTATSYAIKINAGRNNLFDKNFTRDGGNPHIWIQGGVGASNRRVANVTIENHRFVIRDSTNQRAIDITAMGHDSLNIVIRNSWAGPDTLGAGTSALRAGNIKGSQFVTLENNVWDSRLPTGAPTTATGASLLLGDGTNVSNILIKGDQFLNRPSGIGIQDTDTDTGVGSRIVDAEFYNVGTPLSVTTADVYRYYDGTAFRTNRGLIATLMQITPQSAAPGSPTQGDLYVDSDSGELCFYTGSVWVGLVAGGACM